MNELEFTREDLQNIRDTALMYVDDTKNPLWIEAYFDLARAADQLDAMIARSQVEQNDILNSDNNIFLNEESDQESRSE